MRIKGWFDRRRIRKEKEKEKNESLLLNVVKQQLSATQTSNTAVSMGCMEDSTKYIPRSSPRLESMSIRHSRGNTMPFPLDLKVTAKEYRLSKKRDKEGLVDILRVEGYVALDDSALPQAAASSSR